MWRIIALITALTATSCGVVSEIERDPSLDVYIPGMSAPAIFEHDTTVFGDEDRQNWIVRAIEGVGLEPEVLETLKIEFIRDENWPAPGTRGYYTPKLNRVRVRVFDHACQAQDTLIHELLHAKYCNMISLEDDERMCEHPVEIFSHQSGDVAKINYEMGSACIIYQK